MRQSVLIIDDSENIHLLVRAALCDDDLTIWSAYSGDAGLRKAVTSHPDVVLLDIDIPKMDGFEVCKRLRSDLRSTGAEVIFLSAASEAEDKVQALEFGASDYITKPFHPGELRARVCCALRAKARVDMLRSQRVNEFISSALQANLASHA